MLDSDGGCAENYVGKQFESMGAHRHEITTILLNPTDNLLNRFAERRRLAVQSRNYDDTLSISTGKRMTRLGAPA
jgi:hypothetical protein